jgi:hypothetical protein
MDILSYQVRATSVLHTVASMLYSRSKDPMHDPCCCCAKSHETPRRGHEQCDLPLHERILSRHDVLDSSTVTACCLFALDVSTGGSAPQGAEHTSPTGASGTSLQRSPMHNVVTL